MTDVSVLGLGPMGSALARALLGGAHCVTVWNRSAAKAEALVRGGALLAPGAADAVAASAVVIVCVADYAASYAVLESDGASAALKGKVVVQLSTGTPQDARTAQAWAHEPGADYLHGAILATPSQIGRPDTPLFLSGSATALRASEPLLKSIAGTLMPMGDAAGAAAAWDLATLSCVFGAIFGFYHGARICEVEGLRVDNFGSMIAGIAPVIGEMIKHDSLDIQTETYDEPESSMRMCAAGADLYSRHAREAGINAEFPSFLVGLFDKCVVAGYGNERLAALMKVLRAHAPGQK